MYLLIFNLPLTNGHGILDNVVLDDIIVPYRNDFMLKCHKRMDRRPNVSFR